MLDLKLLNVLICPECQIDVIYRRNGKKEELICPQCERIFQIKDSIPQIKPVTKE